MRGRKRHRKKLLKRTRAYMREGAIPTAAEITWGTPPYSWELLPGEKRRKY